MKIGCSFFYTDTRYKHLAQAAIASFKCWHPDVDVFVFDHTNIDVKMPLKYSAGYCKYWYARSLFDKNYDKVISLGVDTFTCGYLKEFIEDNEHDALCTLDFNDHELTFNNILIPRNEHVNADVICFNNKNFLDEVLNLVTVCPNQYFEQGALNQILNVPSPFKIKTVDTNDKDYVYNCRLYYANRDDTDNALWRTRDYTVKNNKLHNLCGREIRVIHHVLGFGATPKDGFIHKVNLLKTIAFNEESKQFFINSCNIPSDWFSNLMTDADWPTDLLLNEQLNIQGFPLGTLLTFNDLDAKEYLRQRYEQKN